MAALKVVCVLVLCMLVVEYSMGAATTPINCNDVYLPLFPCLLYMRGYQQLKYSSCCSKIKAIHDHTKTTPDRRKVCSCLKNAVKKFGLNTKLAEGLPGQCGVSIPYKISASTDCNKIK